jgi:m7GpppX diphosphatase
MTSSYPSFADCKLSEILSITQDGATILLEHHNGEKIIILCTHTTFNMNNFQELISKEIKLNQVQQNDKYAKYEVTATTSKYDINVVYKATDLEIQKHRKVNWRYIRETPEIYQAITLPHITETPEPEWIQNIISGKHNEEVIYEDELFVLCPNITWERSKPSEVYCLAIVKLDIKSLRDIRDFTFLEKMKKIVYDLYEKQFNIRSDEIIAYFHYLPSFWHLHIHFSTSSAVVLGSNRFVAKAILLDDVISNVKMNPNYYELCDLTIQVQETSPIYKKYIEWMENKN